MTSTRNWARNLFVGRLGEAVVEAALSEFGYRVERAGYELATPKDTAVLADRIRPDLLVTDPRTREQTWVEVKARSARPMTVLLDQRRLRALRASHPDTVLAFVSAYNGSVNCRKVRALDLTKLSTSGSLFELDLTDRSWEPLWAHFPKVQPGPRLMALWEQLKTDLQAFGERKVVRRDSSERFPDEGGALADYIKRNWEPRMLIYDIQELEDDDWSLDRLREWAGKVNRFRFALGVLGDENLNSHPFHMLMEAGLAEDYFTLDLQEVRRQLMASPGRLQAFDALINESLDIPRPEMFNFDFLDRMAQILPDGMSYGYLSGGDTSLEEAPRIDLRTAIHFLHRRNALDQRG